MTKKYKLIGNNDLNNILKQTLQNRGIMEDFFQKIDKKNEISYKNLKNMTKGVQLFKKHTDKSSSILIVTDKDIDGFTSSAIIHRYILDNFKCKVENIQHIKRENGLTPYIMSQIELRIENGNKPDLIILPDASSNDTVQHFALNEQDIDVLVLDHHEVNVEIPESDYTVVINPQISPDYTNKQISGVGVTYKFLQALDEEFGLNSADDNIDLVAFGNIGDTMSMAQVDTRSMVQRGLKNLKNETLRELVFKNKHYDRHLSVHAISWDVLPKLNALIRVGEPEELQFVYEGLLGYEGEFENPRARNPKNKVETWAQKATRLCTNAHGKQRRIRNELMDTAVDFIEENGLDKYNIILVPMKDYFTKGLTGTVASQLTNLYGKPVSLMNYNPETKIYSGSSRGMETVLPDLKAYYESTGLVEYVIGHSNAHGIAVHEDNLEALYKHIEENVEFSGVIEVDFEIDYKDVNSTLFKELNDLEVYWGKDIEPPVFAVKNVPLPLKPMEYKPSVTKVKDAGKEITTFSLPTELKELVGQEKIAHSTLIGTLSINRFFNNVADQILVESFIVEKIEDEEELYGFNF